jgi:dCMP deaminase
MNDAMAQHPEKDNRLPWDDYFMEITKMVAKRATCLRRSVGAVLVKDKRIIATGYNGPPRGLRHCRETGCLRTKLNIPSGERHEICRGLHGEQNAIIQAAVHGISIAGATLYCTTQPCVICTKMLINAGIRTIKYAGDYPDELSLAMLEEAGIELVRFTGK